MAKSTNNSGVDDAVRTIRAYLYELGWTDNHKRVQDYLKACSTRLNQLEYQKLEDVPLKVLDRLKQFLKLYADCNQILHLLQTTWRDPLVVNVVQKYSTNGKMPLSGYKNLYEKLENYWFIHGGGF